MKIEAGERLQGVGVGGEGSTRHNKQACPTRPATIGIESYVSLFLVPQARRLLEFYSRLQPSLFGS